MSGSFVNANEAAVAADTVTLTEAIAAAIAATRGAQTASRVFIDTHGAAASQGHGIVAGPAGSPPVSGIPGDSGV